MIPKPLSLLLSLHGQPFPQLFSILYFILITSSIGTESNNKKETEYNWNLQKDYLTEIFKVNIEVYVISSDLEWQYSMLSSKTVLVYDE